MDSPAVLLALRKLREFSQKARNRRLTASELLDVEVCLQMLHLEVKTAEPSWWDRVINRLDKVLWG